MLSMGTSGMQHHPTTWGMHRGRGAQGALDLHGLETGVPALTWAHQGTGMHSSC